MSSLTEALKNPGHHLSQDEWKFLNHKQSLQVHGIYVPGMDGLKIAGGQEIFRLFRINIFPSHWPGVYVPLKLPVVPAHKTPYSFDSGELLYKGEKWHPGGVVIRHVPMAPEENTWHLKGYTLPFDGTTEPYKELRINLRISGCCPGRCLFCHRWHSHRVKPGETRKNDARMILDRLLKEEGPDVLGKVRQVLVISELFGSETAFLDTLSSARETLDKYGYPGDKPFGCSASDARSYDGLKRLLTLVRPSRYSFSLEFFRSRNRYMSRYKALPMEDVYRVLSNARKAGFREIQLNYMAGIDSLEECAEGMEKLAERGLVDSVGLSTFTAFSEEQLQLRHEEAWEPLYYHQLVSILMRLGIKVFRPESFDMGTPFSILMEKTQ
jgi:hypothetical protein